MLRLLVLSSCNQDKEKITSIVECACAIYNYKYILYIYGMYHIYMIHVYYIFVVGVDGSKIVELLGQTPEG